MPYRLTKIYTRKGDDGYTHLGDRRLPKDDLLVEVVGTIDELNSAIGLALSFESQSQSVTEALTQIQHELFDLGGELHLPECKAITPGLVAKMEQLIDIWNKSLPPLKEFVLPRGTSAVAACHLARTICRRAERNMVKLNHQSLLPNQEMLKYINRLSDLLFVAARMMAKATHQSEVLWEHEKK